MVHAPAYRRPSRGNAAASNHVETLLSSRLKCATQTRLNRPLRARVRARRGDARANVGPHFENLFCLVCSLIWARIMRAEHQRDCRAEARGCRPLPWHAGGLDTNVGTTANWEGVFGRKSDCHVEPLICALGAATHWEEYDRVGSDLIASVPPHRSHATDAFDHPTVPPQPAWMSWISRHDWPVHKPTGSTKRSGS